MTQRPIKFRAWGKKEKKMLVIQSLHWGGALVQISQTAIIKMDYHMGACAQGDTLKRDQYELMQYTGLTDRNGKEIYEGDIVHYVHPTHYTERDLETVVFEDGMFYAGKHGGSSTAIKPKILRGRRLEVIGNVFENLDLLETAV